MKGVYSSPDSVLGREVQQALFPDNTYGVDSGGDPVVIPELTFGEFQDFHSRFYHPSNSRLWFYGDDDTEKRLEILDNYLKEFTAREVTDSRIAKQKLFDAPKKVVRTYAAGDEEAEARAGERGAAEALHLLSRFVSRRAFAALSLACSTPDSRTLQGCRRLSAIFSPLTASPFPQYLNPKQQPKAFLTVNWVLNDDAFDLETSLAWGFLDHLLLGTPAAPLRQALESSGLGEALTGGGLEDELRQPTWGVGLKGVKPENTEKVEKLILGKLEELAREGFTDEAVAASLNTIEFNLRENNTGRFPRGLSLMLRSVASWLYEKDAFEPLRFSAPLEHLKKRLAAKEDVWRPLLRQYLLSNKHRVTLELQPDNQLGQQMEQQEREKCDQKRGSMNPKQIEELVESTKALKARGEQFSSEARRSSCLAAARLHRPFTNLKGYGHTE